MINRTHVCVHYLVEEYGNIKSDLLLDIFIYIVLLFVICAI